MLRVQVEAKTAYEVVIGGGILDGLGAAVAALPGRHRKKAAIITDDNVHPLYGDAVARSLQSAGYETHTHVFPQGEGSKTMARAMEIVAFLCDNAFTRSDLAVALGGGVVGDITGFAAAIYQRGMDYIQVPTTLLAAVDSSVGGKTAVNIPQGKNLVGAFWQPRLVWCDTTTLNTLPPAVFNDGMAEVIKYGCIWDNALFSRLEQPGALEDLVAIIADCVRIKAQVVRQDEFDTGLRQILNFGHTMGHAIEKASEFTVSHGSAVAMGMVLCAAAGERVGITPNGVTRRIEGLLERNSLPTRSPYPLSRLSKLCLGDKKRSGDSIAVILLEDMGRSVIHPVGVEDVDAFFDVNL